MCIKIDYMKRKGQYKAVYEWSSYNPRGIIHMFNSSVVQHAVQVEKPIFLYLKSGIPFSYIYCHKLFSTLFLLVKILF